MKISHQPLLFGTFASVLFLASLAHAQLQKLTTANFKVYVTNQADNTVAVIDGPSRKITSTASLDTRLANDPATKMSAKHMAMHDYSKEPAMDKQMMTDFGPHHVVYGSQWCGGRNDVLRGGVNNQACPSGSRWLFTSNIVAGSVSVIDSATDKSMYTIKAGTKTHGIILSPDERQVWVANKGGTVGVIDLATKKAIAQIPVPFNSTWVLFSKDGKRAYANGKKCTDGKQYHESSGPACAYQVAKIDVASLKVTEILTAPKGQKAKPVDMALAQDYARENDHHIVSLVHNRQGGETVRFAEIDSYAHGAVKSLDGKLLYVTVPKENYVAVVDIATNAVLTKIRVSENPHIPAISPDGKHVWVVCRMANTVDIIDTATRKVVASVPVGKRPHGIDISSR